MDDKIFLLPGFEPNIFDISQNSHLDKINSIVNGACCLVSVEDNLLNEITELSHCKDKVYSDSWEAALRGKDITFLLIAPLANRKNPVANTVLRQFPNSIYMEIKLQLCEDVVTDAIIIYIDHNDYVHPTKYWAALEWIRHQVTGYTKNPFYYKDYEEIINNLASVSICTSFPSNNYYLYSLIRRYTVKDFYKCMEVYLDKSEALVDFNYLGKVRKMLESGDLGKYLTRNSINSAIWHSTPQGVINATGILVNNWLYMDRKSVV